MKNPRGKLNEKEEADATRGHSEREEMPGSAFLDSEARTYPVKVKRGGDWKYDRDLLLAAEREANMHGRLEIAARAKSVLEREFGRAHDSLAMDKSARTYDADGRLHVARSHISKAAVNPYYGREIPGCEQLGLDPDKVYRLLRDPKELEKATPTFARLPILKEHVPVSADAPQPDLVIGAIGSCVVFDNPYLDADLSFWIDSAIAGIETGTVKELSCAYRYVPVMGPGEFDGDHYDGRMTEIQGNHLALVEDGRAGSDVVVADRDPFQTSFKERTMKMTKLGKALFAALSGLSPRLAQDAALGGIVGNAVRKGFSNIAIKEKLLALDATLNPQQLDNVIDALLDVNDNPEPKEVKKPLDEGAGDEEDPREKLRKILAGKVDDAVMDEALDCFPKADAKDGKGGTFPPDEGLDEKLDEKGRTGPKSDDAEEEPMKKKDVDRAMDSLGKKLRTQFKDAAEAARDVRTVVGDVIGMDSAVEIYGFALDQMQVDRKGVEGVSALRALFRVAGNRLAQARVIVSDSTELEKRFPNVARFGRE